jgi:queuine tRNA-ribosyltransferase
MQFSFEIKKKSKKSRARTGVINTLHGVIQTPAFIPVATQATVKGITVEQLKQIGVEAILANTYHLYLRPGDKIVKKFGGLHKFMGWDGPLFTDSGGYQVFSLGAGIEHGVGKISNIFPAESRRPPVWPSDQRNKDLACLPAAKITEEGVYFKSHLDGSVHFIGPEESIKIQENLGADIIFTFDECTSPLHDYQYTKKSMERTHRWAMRCLTARAKSEKRKIENYQALFGIVQGGEYKDLRLVSAKFIGSLNFDGFGIGGSLGKSKEDMYKVLGWTMPLLPENKPKHLLGIGSVEDIEKSVKYGIDTFDCVIPTRLGRNGSALTKKGTDNIRSVGNRLDKNPIEKNCGCYACRNFARYYLRHLFKAGEMLGPILVTIHNLWFMENLMREIRGKIERGKI